MYDSQKAFVKAFQDFLNSQAAEQTIPPSTRLEFQRLADIKNQGAVLRKMAWELLGSDELRSAFEARRNLFPDFDINPLFEQLREAQSRVCHIEGLGSQGTGFLIGPDQVMTNYHVVESLLTNKVDTAAHRELVVRFDNHLISDGNISKPQEFRLQDVNWSVASAKYGPQEALGDFETEPPPEALDFAVLRLKGTPGKDQITLSSGKQVMRGWFKLDQVIEAPSEGTVAFVFHHPLGKPLKLSFHEFMRPNATGTRIRYKANTDFGSSGGLVVNDKLVPVAIHHAGPADPGSFNQGVPLAKIRTFLADSKQYLEGQILHRAEERPLCILLVPQFNDPNLHRRVQDVTKQLLTPAIVKAGYNIEDLSDEPDEVMDPNFSPMRTAALVLAYMGPQPDPFIASAVGFRAATGRPLVVVSESPPFAVNFFKLGAEAARASWYDLPEDQAAGDTVDAISTQIRVAAQVPNRGPQRLHPWTLIEFNADDTAAYLDATPSAARLLVGEGESLVGRNGLEVVESLKLRVDPEQWDHFDRDQVRLYSALQSNTPDWRSAQCANIPFVFTHGSQRTAYIPIITRHSSRGRRHRLEVIHLDVSSWITRARDGHYELKAPVLDAVERLDRVEQLKGFVPLGILRANRDGVLTEANAVALTLLGYKTQQFDGLSLEAISSDLTFCEDADPPSRHWYRWDEEPEPRLPPLGIHRFQRLDGKELWGCYLGYRDATSGDADGCDWIFGFVDPADNANLVEDRRSRSEREWIWECYAASYDRVLLSCEYYVETRDRHVREVLNKIKGVPNPRVLDIGAGTGNVSLALLESHPTVVVDVVDSSAAMLRAMKWKLVENFRPRCRIHAESAEEIGFLHELYDAVTCMMALFDMDDHKHALQHADRLLKHNGLLVITEPIEDMNVNTIIDGARQQLMDAKRMERLVKHWNVVMASGKELAKRARKRDSWMGVENVKSWLEQRGYVLEQSPASCYFNQCRTLIARKH